MKLNLKRNGGIAVGDFLKEEREKWEDRVRKNKEDERYNEHARRYNEDVVRPHNEYVERNPEFAREQGIKKLDRREEREYNWVDHAVAEYTASLHRTIRFKNEEEAREWVESDKRAERISQEMNEKKERYEREEEKRQQEEWDREHPKEVAKREKRERKRQEELERKHPAIRWARERREFEQKQRELEQWREERERIEREKIELKRKKRENFEIWKQEHPEEWEKQKRNQREWKQKERERIERERTEQAKKDLERIERKRIDLENLEKWKREHPEEWEKQEREREELERKQREEREEREKREKRRRYFWALFSNPFGLISGGLWFAFFDMAIAAKNDLGGYWSVCGIQSVVSGVLFFIIGWVCKNIRFGFEIGGAGLIIGAIVAVPLGLLVGVIPIETSITIGGWAGACVGAVILFFKLDDAKYTEKIVSKRRNLVPFCTLFGVISGGAWFATLDVAVAAPIAYGGYWCIWGVHGLTLVILFSICEGLNTGLIRGCKLGSILLVIGPIVIGVVALLGLLVGAISITASIIIGALSGAFWGAIVSSHRESENTKQ